MIIVYYVFKLAIGTYDEIYPRHLWDNLQRDSDGIPHEVCDFGSDAFYFNECDYRSDEHRSGLQESANARRTALDNIVFRCFYGTNKEFRQRGRSRHFPIPEN